MKDPEPKGIKSFGVAYMDPILLARVKMYASGHGIPIYKAFQKLLWKGLAAEANDPGAEDSLVDVMVIARTK